MPAERTTDRFAPAELGELHPGLGAWEKNVGAPVALDVAEPAGTAIDGLTVICWNLAIGTARLHALLRRLRGGEIAAALPDPRWPLVILAQEAYRVDATVPPECVGRAHGGRLRARHRHDIATIAAAEGLSLRYAPSMRNGAGRSDRGNAILSSIPIARARSFLLPYVRQRRVVVTAELEDVPDLLLASAHLDTGGRLRREARFGTFGGGRVAQATALARELAAAPDKCVVLGADLNTPRGVRDPAVRELVAAGLHPATRHGQWWHTFHGPIRLLLDHVLFRTAAQRIAAVDLYRIDEVPGDRGRRVFGSDHHPLLARVRFREAVQPHARPAPASAAADQPSSRADRPLETDQPSAHADQPSSRAEQRPERAP